MPFVGQLPFTPRNQGGRLEQFMNLRQINETNLHRMERGKSMSDFFLGQITPFAFNFAPRYWAFCHGQLLSIQQNTALFSLLGTYYGGNGVNNFALPNLQGRSPMAYGNAPEGQVPLGQSFGTENVTLTIPQMPGHTHLLGASTSPGTVRAPTGNQFAQAQVDIYGQGSPVVLSTSTCGAAGGNQPHSNMQPYTVLNFCIALSGIYPSRN